MEAPASKDHVMTWWARGAPDPILAGSPPRGEASEDSQKPQVYVVPKTMVIDMQVLCTQTPLR